MRTIDKQKAPSSKHLVNAIWSRTRRWHIWLFGGAGLTTSFLNKGLIDELSPAVHPVILGGGKPPFINILPLNGRRGKS